MSTSAAVRGAHEETASLVGGARCTAQNRATDPSDLMRENRPCSTGCGANWTARLGRPFRRLPVGPVEQWTAARRPCASVAESRERYIIRYKADGVSAVGHFYGGNRRMNPQCGFILLTPLGVGNDIHCTIRTCNTITSEGVPHKA